VGLLLGWRRRESTSAERQAALGTHLRLRLKADNVSDADHLFEMHCDMAKPRTKKAAFFSSVVNGVLVGG
jgi:hypothetical protein